MSDNIRFYYRPDFNIGLMLKITCVSEWEIKFLDNIAISDFSKNILSDIPYPIESSWSLRPQLSHSCPSKMNAKTNKHATSPKLPCDPDHPTQLRIQTDKCRGREDDQHFCCVAYYTFHTRCLLRPCPSERSLCSGSCRVKTWCGFGSICRWTAGGWRVNAPWWRKHWDRAWSQQKKTKRINVLLAHLAAHWLTGWCVCTHICSKGLSFRPKNTDRHQPSGCGCDSLILACFNIINILSLFFQMWMSAWRTTPVNWQIQRCCASL